ncbi:hypothetical protein HDU96_004568 [Phlyctochytrium bullatum]|nr:hypothetical protein HDU96_004568 [Phlyctochytrium bullatum]
MTKLTLLLALAQVLSYSSMSLAAPFLFRSPYTGRPASPLYSPPEGPKPVICIERLLSCGPLTSAEHGSVGTIVKCNDDGAGYSLVSACDADGIHACTLVEGRPVCTAGEGKDGVYDQIWRFPEVGLGAASVEAKPLNGEAVKLIDVAPNHYIRRRSPQFDLTPSTPRPIVVQSPNGNDNPIKLSVDTSTPYGRQGLNKCQYDILLRITSVFETSNPNLGFGYCGNYNDGQGFSAGFIQFTTSSGGCLRVVQAYKALTSKSDSWLLSFLPALEEAARKGNGGRTSGPGYTQGLSDFCDAWNDATENDADAFKAAQFQIQSEGYLIPNEDLVKRLGLKTALGVGQIMDAGIQLGYSGIESIVAGSGTPPSEGADEVAFINRFLDARIRYLNNLGGAYPGTKYRINSYRYMLQKGNLNFSGGKVEMLENGGNPMTITCNDKF